MATLYMEPWPNRCLLRGCHVVCPQQAKAFEKAIEAYERAANGQERLNSPWHAAKHLEQVCILALLGCRVAS